MEFLYGLASWVQCAKGTEVYYVSKHALRLTTAMLSQTQCFQAVCELETFISMQILVTSMLTFLVALLIRHFLKTLCDFVCTLHI